MSFFQKIVIPIPILVPTAAGIDSIVESVPGLEWIPIKEWAILNSKRKSQETVFPTNYPQN